MQRVNQLTGQQRVLSALHPINAPTYCPECGSTFFVKLQAAQYTPSANNFREVSTSPQYVYLCPCGAIKIPPGYNASNPSGSERDLFAQALDAAVARRAENTLDQVAKGTVGIAEYNTLKAQMTDLLARFNDVLSGEGAQPFNEDEINDLGPVMEEPMAAVTDEAPITNAEVRLVGTGNYGRSAAATTAPSADNTKYVESTGRPFAPGGARGRMARQGAK